MDRFFAYIETLPPGQFKIGIVGLIVSLIIYGLLVYHMTYKKWKNWDSSPSSLTDDDGYLKNSN